MKVLVSGSSGLIGKALFKRLESEGFSVSALVRRSEQRGVYWNVKESILNPAHLEGFDAVIHLAGEGIAEGRWTDEKKKAIYESRVLGTRLLVERLVQTQDRPKVFICASAIGFYKPDQTKELTEESPSGNNFLAKVCIDWEKEAEAIEAFGVRRVSPRIGIVLSPMGGALSKMIIPFKLGLGGNLGNGQQYMPWIDLEDIVEAFLFCLKSDKLQGPVNFTAPEPVTQEEFSKTLAGIFHRPHLLNTPEFLLKMIAGEMADELLLSSYRVTPTKLNDAGFEFRFRNLKESLKHQLQK